MSFQIDTGIRPNSPVRNSAVKPLRLMPGEKLEITVSEHYDRLERFIGTRHPLNQIHKIQVEIGSIIFEDGIAWTATPHAGTTWARMPY
jgi:hypothetical protein